jgi:hypothetical protein
MLILINDLMQESTIKAAYPELSSPALSDIYTVTGGTFTITLPDFRRITHMGVGNTDATWFRFNGSPLTDVLLEPVQGFPDSYQNGLYEIPYTFSANTLTITTDATYIGRFALANSDASGTPTYFGVHDIGLSPAREPGLWDTSQTRETLSGQLIEGAGGISGRQITVDARYKITETMFQDIERAAANGSLNYPYFVLFNKETHRMPWERMYAKIISNEVIFQSSVNSFLYSRKFKLKEMY